MKKFYHYTPEFKLQTIIDSGEIKLATKSVGHKKEKPVAWVSSNEFWEHTATKMAFIDGNIKQLTFEEQLRDIGCARIEVCSTGIMSWAKLIHKAKMNPFIASIMEEKGIQMGGKPSEWYGSLNAIKKKNWSRAEVFRNGEWVLFESFQSIEAL
ncbi:hypothetical protein DBR28_19420 [Chryseobacterium sp. HMWF028]|nr:hypothetical protein DBR28_19420 [Chryseobacterium sp. HMWF028]